MNDTELEELFEIIRDDSQVSMKGQMKVLKGDIGVAYETTTDALSVIKHFLGIYHPGLHDLAGKFIYTYFLWKQKQIKEGR